MSDQHVRDNKFSYNSNLVIQREKPNRADEPTGEPESLAGRIDPKQMGQMFQRDKPKKEVKSVQQSNLVNSKRKTKIAMHGSANVMSQNIDENLIYRPKTKENRLQYEKILSIVYNILQEQSQEVIKSVVDEILAVLKNETAQTDKKTEIEGLVGKITIEQYSDLLLASKAINDYNPEMEETYDKYEEEIKIPVTFDEEQAAESSDEDVQEIAEDEEEVVKMDVDDEGIKATFQRMEEEVEQYYDIDGYWLHAQINQIFNDPVKSQEIEGEVLRILNSQSDIECENKLVALFSHDNFELIKLLHANRLQIYFQTLLGQAQNEEDKKLIEEDMAQTEQGQKLLERIKFKGQQQIPRSLQIDEEKNGKDFDFEKRLTEAINITDAEFQNVARKTVDLEGMIFNQQGHFMSNDKCHLPPGSFKMAKKGYEEIYIPAVKHKGLKDKLVKIEELPKWAQPAFKGFKELNVIQSRVLEQALNSAENLLICAPTGAGKTNIALLAMLQVIGNYIDDKYLFVMINFKFLAVVLI